jgi:large subunit ribosomal protein L22
MGKAKSERRLSELEAQAVGTAIRTSARKLNLVAASIRGMKAAQALTSLDFTKRRIAKDVKRVLLAAIANAENNHQLDVDRLVVKEASVGRSFVLRRWMPRGRGKSSHYEKPFSRLTVVVEERDVAVKSRGGNNKGSKASTKPQAAAEPSAQAGA